MHIKNTFTKIIQAPWFISLLLFGVFYGVVGYTLGWDDQHLEIPLLKHLIDPELYQGDYYIESLRENFSSFFYPILSKLITVEQIPGVYFVLFLISRYFMFYWMYKLWLHIAKDPFKAIACVLTFILMIRVEEFSYRTFSHQEFALAIIFAGIYYFFKERFILAGALLGIAANFHALYSAFPMFFIGLYLVWQIRKHGFKNLFGSCIGFIGCAAPWLIWIFKNRFGAEAANDVTLDPNWLALFITACPQNFFYPQLPQIPWEKLTSDLNVFYYFNQAYILLVAMWIVNAVFNRTFQQSKKGIMFCLGATFLLGVCFMYTYVQPNRFVIDLNLIRNTQYLTFFLVGFTVILVMNSIEKGRPLLGFSFAILFTFLKYTALSKTAALGGMFAILLFLALKEKWLPKNILGKIVRFVLMLIAIAGILLSIRGIFASFDGVQFRYVVKLNMIIIFALLILNYFAHLWIDKDQYQQMNKRLFIFIPLIIFTFQFGLYSYNKNYEQKYAHGFWQLQRNWEDMQRFVKANTPKDAMLLVPYDMEMGGFRIFSDRKVVMSYRDCGIIGFDYNATVEWTRRMKDIERFKVHMKQSPMPAIRNAIEKYQANYIVFMRYAAPRDNQLMHRVYTNTDFVLFKVQGI